MVRRTSVLEEKRSRNRVCSTRPSSRKARYSRLRRHDPPGLNGQHDLDRVPLVGGDQVLVDLAGEQRIDVGVVGL
jgi:hypothetical protein